MTLPLEIIRLILIQLSKKELLHILKQPPNYDWFIAAASIYYRQLKFTNLHQLYACYNLFQQTQRQREKKEADKNKGFYSSFNYAHFVKELNFSLVQETYNIENHIILQLAMDCSSLKILDLHNCFLITNRILTTLLSRFTQLEQLSIEACSYVNIKTFLNKNVQLALQRLKSLNISVIPYFFNFDDPDHDNSKRSPISFPVLEELKLGDIDLVSSHWFQLFMKGCSSIKKLYLQHMNDERLISYLQPMPFNLNAISFYMCILKEKSIHLLLSQKKLKSITLKKCRYKSSLSHQQIVSLFMPLLTLNYDYVKALNFKDTGIPPETTTSILSKLPDHGLTTFISPIFVDASIIQILKKKKLSLTHLSITSCMKYLIERDVLTSALTTWHSTLTWLEICFVSLLATTFDKQVKEQAEQHFIVDLLNWSPHNRMQVLKLTDMTFKLSLGHLKKLSECFPQLHYLQCSIHPSSSIESNVLKQLVKKNWTKLKGLDIENWDEIKNHENYQGDQCWEWFTQDYQNNIP